MAKRRADYRYHGVFKAPNGFAAWVKPHKKVLRLGYYESEIHAALAADFARYILWGMEYERWPHRGDKPKAEPNFGPCGNLPFNRQTILRNLFKNGYIGYVRMNENLTQYDAAARKLQAETV